MYPFYSFYYDVIPPAMYSYLHNGTIPPNTKEGIEAVHRILPSFLYYQVSVYFCVLSILILLVIISFYLGLEFFLVFCANVM